MASEVTTAAGTPGAGSYVGRFAPSPTGLLHAGSLVAALASWLDTRAHGGRWLVRIEDSDTPRCISGAGEGILRQLAACGLVPDEPPVWQSVRGERYAEALAALQRPGWMLIVMGDMRCAESATAMPRCSRISASLSGSFSPASTWSGATT